MPSLHLRIDVMTHDFILYHHTPNSKTLDIYRFACPSNCRGRGVCDFDHTSGPKCTCCNPNDLSEDCSFSPTCEMDMNGPKDGNFFCGTDYEDASRCNNIDRCPGGRNSECNNGQFCYDVLKCKDKNYHCGSTEAAAAECSTPCVTGSSSQCPMDQQCYDVPECTDSPGVIGVDGKNYCGMNFQDASQCLRECGADGACPALSTCFSISNCLEDDNKFCGTSPADARKCNRQCPGGNPDCDAGEQCYHVNADTCEVPSPTRAPTLPSPNDPPTNVDVPDEITNRPTPAPLKYCGDDIHEASQCALACDTDSDCGINKDCIVVENCHQFCGESTTMASQCGLSCPSGRNSECPDGQSCFTIDNCDHYCGNTLTEASSCSLSCPSGLDSECPIGEGCFPGIKECNHFCGDTLATASQCGLSCPSGRSSECPNGQSCFPVQSCNRFCGNTLSAATQCTEPCATDGDCPGDSKCHDVEQCNRFCVS